MGRTTLLALLFAALAGAFWWHRVYYDAPVGAVPMGYHDLFWHALPSATFLHDQLRHGNLPFWNPYQMAGQPYLALYVNGVLYPPNLLFLTLFSPARALEALVVFHFAVAGLFTWLFGARLGLSPAARAAAAVGVMFSQIQIHSIYMVPCLATRSWLPAMLWALHGLLAEARWRWAVAFALSTSLAFLGGYVSGIYYALLVALAYGAFGLLAVAQRGTRLRVLGLALASGVVTFGLCAPQLLPTVELTALSVRPFDGLTYPEAALGSIPPWMLLRGVLGLTPEADAMQRVATTVWPVVPLVLGGVLARRLRAHWLFALGGVVIAGLYILGHTGPVFRLFYALPLGKSLRGPWQMLSVYHFLVAVLVGIGIDGIAERIGGAQRRARASRVVAVGLALLFGATLYARTGLPTPPPVTARPAPGEPAEIAAVLRTASHRERVFLESPAFYVTPKVGMVHEMFALPDYDSNMPAVYQRFLTGGSERTWQGHLSLASPPDARRLAVPRLRSLDLMSVRYYATLGPVSPQTAQALARIGAAAIQRGRGWALFERREALPRAYVVGRVLEAGGFDAALARVEHEGFRPREEAVVSGAHAALAELRAATPEASAGVGHAEILRYATEEVEIAARCERPCLLVLTDLHYPGWRAEVGGQAVPILPTNALFRGIPLAPGDHRVVFRFEPATLRRGVLLLGAALVLVGVGSWRGFVRHRGGTS